jgi:hypothetical protein
MIARCLGHGLRTASKRPALVSILWAANAALGLLATIPVWAWWRDGFAPAPAADTLLDGFNFATYFDLAHYNRSAVTGSFYANVVALVVTAWVLGALAFGGVLEILRATDGRTFMHRFFRGAGHFFGRFLRLAVYTAISAVVVVGLVAAVLVPLLKPLDESAWEPGWIVAIAIRAVVIGAVLLYFVLVLDYARIRVAINDTRRVFVTWFTSLGFVVRHLAGTYAIAVAFGVLVGVLLFLYLVYCSVTPVSTTTLILLLLVVQQAVMWLRTGTRIAQIAAEIEFFESVRVAVPTAVPEPPATAPPAPDTVKAESVVDNAEVPQPQ